jgi:5-formyltetrahydrofolate cyclo-ligase
MDAVLTSKAAMRRDAMARRDGLEIDDRLEWDAAMAAHALALPELSQSQGPVAGYWPMRSEADPRPILVELAARGIPTCLPVVINGMVVFRRWTAWEPLVPGGFGTLVPSDDAQIIEPVFLLVPLLAFDSGCFRLGYGKGHYDRVLARLRAGGRKTSAFGLAYDVQCVPRVPTEGHDAKLDGVITERRVIRAVTLSA